MEPTTATSMSIDPTVLGVIIGAIASVFGTFLGHFFSYHKEKSQWERDKITKAEERFNLENLERKNAIKNIYSNLMRILSLLFYKQAKEDKKSDEVKEVDCLMTDLTEWLSLLEIHLLQTKAYKDLKDFQGKRDQFFRHNDIYLSHFFDYMKYLAAKESSLNNDIDQCQNENDIEIAVMINREARKKQFVEGKVCSGWYRFNININETTKSQREKMLQPYLASNEIPESFTLRIPLNADAKNSREWPGVINMHELSKTELLSRWENDYEKALKQIRGTV